MSAQLPRKRATKRKLQKPPFNIDQFFEQWDWEELEDSLEGLQALEEWIRIGEERLGFFADVYLGENLKDVIACMRELIPEGRKRQANQE